MQATKEPAWSVAVPSARHLSRKPTCSHSISASRPDKFDAAVSTRVQLLFSHLGLHAPLRCRRKVCHAISKDDGVRRQQHPQMKPREDMRRVTEATRIDATLDGQASHAFQHRSPRRNCSRRNVIQQSRPPHTAPTRQASGFEKQLRSVAAKSSVILFLSCVKISSSAIAKEEIVARCRLF
jgi:hypothetical protein